MFNYQYFFHATSPGPLLLQMPQPAPFPATSERLPLLLSGPAFACRRKWRHRMDSYIVYCLSWRHRVSSLSSTSNLRDPNVWEERLSISSGIRRWRRNIMHMPGATQTQHQFDQGQCAGYTAISIHSEPTVVRFGAHPHSSILYSFNLSSSRSKALTW